MHRHQDRRSIIYLNVRGFVWMISQTILQDDQRPVLIPYSDLPPSVLYDSTHSMLSFLVRSFC